MLFECGVTEVFFRCCKTNEVVFVHLVHNPSPPPFPHTHTHTHTHTHRRMSLC